MQPLKVIEMTKVVIYGHAAKVKDNVDVGRIWEGKKLGQNNTLVKRKIRTKT